MFWWILQRDVPRGILGVLVELVVPGSGGSSLSGVVLAEDLKQGIHVDLWAYLLLLPPLKKNPASRN